MFFVCFFVLFHFSLTTKTSQRNGTDKSIYTVNISDKLIPYHKSTCAMSHIYFTDLYSFEK